MGKTRHNLWVRFHQDFIDHPKTAALAVDLAAIGVQEVHARDVAWGQWSRLAFHLWQSRSNGSLRGISPVRFAQIVQWHDMGTAPRLWEAWRRSGFIDDPDGPEARLHDFDEAFDGIRRLEADATRKRLDYAASSGPVVAITAPPRTRPEGLDPPPPRGPKRPFSTETSEEISPENSPETSAESPRRSPTREASASSFRLQSVDQRDSLPSFASASASAGTPAAEAEARRSEAGRGDEAGMRVLPSPTEIAALWNALCPRFEPALDPLPEAVAAQIAAVVAAEPDRDWPATFRRAHAAQFLHGGTNGCFRPRLGWIVKAERLFAIDTGKWDRRGAPRAEVPRRDPIGNAFALRDMRRGSP